MENWKPLNPEFRERVTQSFERQPMLKTLGAILAKVEPGYCEVHLPFRPELSQHHGYLHGGGYSFLADTAGGYAAYTLLALEDSAMTVEYKVNMLRPGKGERFIAKGTVIKPGRTLSIVKADIYSVENGTEILCATSLQTIIVMRNTADNSNQ